jgi:hypothetical protein
MITNTEVRKYLPSCSFRIWVTRLVGDDVLDHRLHPGEVLR